MYKLFKNVESKNVRGSDLMQDSIILLAMLRHAPFLQTFILYDGGGAATARLTRLVSSASSADPQLHVRVVAWNPPLDMSSSDVNNAVATDCLLRIRAVADTVVTLNMTQLLVPRRHDNVADALASIGGGKLRENV